MRSEGEVTAMACPVCKVPLAMSDRQGIEIDYCPQCRGVWLDRGELDKIIERSSSEPPRQQPQQAAPPPPPPHSGFAQPHHGGQHYHYGKRKKHWLNEIFD